MITRKITADLEAELKSNKAIVLTGMRRVGKTTLIRYLYEKIQDERKVYLDLENPLNQRYFQEIDFDKVKITLEQLAVGQGERLVVFLDEIQNVRTIPSIVKYLSDHYQIKFILTGSASFYLKNLFSESLAGRKRIFELHPLDFEEFLSFKAPNFVKPALKDRISETTFLLYEKYISEYLKYGGFPSVALSKSHQEKIKEIEDIFSSYFQKEVQLLSDFRKIDKFRSAILLLAGRVGSRLDISKISAELGISRITLEEYIDFLEGTYFISRIKPYSKNLDVKERKQAKPYLCDIGFLTVIAQVSPFVVLENAIFNLVKRHGKVFFYQSKSGSEIDFIVARGNKLLAYEVKTFPHPSDLAKLKKTAGKIGINDYFIVSQKFSKLSNVVYPVQL